MLAGNCQLSNVIHASNVPGLSVLTSGPRASRPADLFSTPRLKEVLSALEQQFDFVLLDTPAILAVSDAQILAASADGVLLNVRCGQNGGPSVALAEALLHQSGANVLGVALNRASAMARPELVPPRYVLNGVAESKKAIGV